jgi:hypothetical protein
MLERFIITVVMEAICMLSRELLGLAQPVTVDQQFFPDGAGPPLGFLSANNSISPYTAATCDWAGVDMAAFDGMTSDFRK